MGRLEVKRNSFDENRVSTLNNARARLVTPTEAYGDERRRH